MSTDHCTAPVDHRQFGLRSLLGFTALLGLIAATGSWVGNAAAVMLMLFAIAIAVRRGELALVGLGAAALAADAAHANDPGPSPAVLPEVLVFSVAVLVCLWQLSRTRRPGTTRSIS